MPRALHNPHFSRRNFLRAAGLPMAAAPFLPLSRAAAGGVFPKRLVLFFTPHGTLWERFRPVGVKRDFTLGPLLSPLNRHRAHLTLLAGLQVRAPGVGAPHTKGPALLWTASPLLGDRTFVRRDASGGTYFGWNSGPSIDQVIAREIGGTTPYRSLELGVRAGSSHPGSRMIYAGAKQPLPPESDPRALMGRLFGTGGDGYERLRADRKSGIDVLHADLAAFAREVSGDDRDKIDQHLQAVRSIETRLDRPPTTCPSAPVGAVSDPMAVQNTPAVFDLQIDALAGALACDLTRVASLQFRVGENDNDRYTWLGIEEGHHTLSHAGDGAEKEREQLAKIYTWYAAQFARLLDKLAAVREGDGSLLDNTVVVWGSEVAKGNTHSFDRVPFVVAGGGGGALRPGRFLELPAQTPHNRLLVALAHTMGVPQIETFGATDTGRGPLADFLA